MKATSHSPSCPCAVNVRSAASSGSSLSTAAAASVPDPNATRQPYVNRYRTLTPTASEAGVATRGEPRACSRERPAAGLYHSRAWTR